MEMPNYTQKEEKLHVLTHGFGLIISLIGLVLLIYKANSYSNQKMLLSFLIFGGSLILCFSSSTLYHAVQNLELKKKLRLLDHFAIYSLIAGTYTPFLLLNLPNSWSIYVLIGIWTIALFGIIFKFIVRKKLQSYEKLDLSFYIIMGTLSLFLLKPMVEHTSFEGIVLLFVGGFSYLIGTYFYANKNISYNHVIWHLWVIMGAGAHFFAVLFYAVPRG